MTTTVLQVRISRGCREFQRRRRVTQADVARLGELACRGLREISLQAEVMCFRVDGEEVSNPVGLECDRVEVDMKITTAAGREPEE